MSSSKNTNLAISIICLVIGMTLLSFAAVPIYSLFCKMTGYGGTTQIAKIIPTKRGERNIKVKFNATTADALPWHFTPIQDSITVKPGQVALVFYVAENYSDQDIIGTATYNVTPDKTGIYFNKVQCFCFEEQLLKAGQKMMMPVSFFIDPEIENDPDAKDIDTITLSYTFFKLK